jgi:hypothetical protein
MNILLKLLKKIFPLSKAEFMDKLYGKACTHCGHREHRDVRYYARGYNHLCSQASGDDGELCSECFNISFLRTDEEFLRTLPYWCTDDKGVAGLGLREWNKRPEYWTNYDPRKIHEDQGEKL